MSDGKKRKEAPSATVTRSMRRRLDEEDKEKERIGESGTLLKGLNMHLLAHILGYAVDRNGPYPYSGICKQMRKTILDMTSKDLDLIQLYENDLDVIDVDNAKDGDRRPRYKRIVDLRRVSHLTTRANRLVYLPIFPSLCSVHVTHCDEYEFGQWMGNMGFTNVRDLYLTGGYWSHETYNFTGRGPFDAVEFLCVTGAEVILPSMRKTFPRLREFHMQDTAIYKSDVTVDVPLEVLGLESSVEKSFVKIVEGGSIDFINLGLRRSLSFDTGRPIGPEPVRVQQLRMEEANPRTFSLRFLEVYGIVPLRVEVILNRTMQSSDLHVLLSSFIEQQSVIHIDLFAEGSLTWRGSWTYQELEWIRTHVRVFRFLSLYLCDSRSRHIDIRRTITNTMEEPADDGCRYGVIYTA